jgi:hypothetical protein
MGVRMTAIQIIAELMNLVEKHGDREVIVYDGGDGDFCVASDIEVRDVGKEPRKDHPYFHIRPGEYLPSWASFKDDADPQVRAERTQLIGEIAKTLTANSPFLSIINGGTFPKLDDKADAGVKGEVGPS